MTREPCGSSMSRPLNIKEKMSKMVCDVSEIAQTYQAIFSGRGLVAENGDCHRPGLFVRAGFKSGSFSPRRHSGGKTRLT